LRHRLRSERNDVALLTDDAEDVDLLLHARAIKSAGGATVLASRLARVAAFPQDVASIVEVLRTDD
jgi:hypothetical protein